MNYLYNYINFILNENLYTSGYFNDIITFLSEEKLNKVAYILKEIFSTSHVNKDMDLYKDKDINYLSDDSNDNMISYLPKNKQNKLKLLDKYDPSIRTSARIGRVIKKILEQLKTETTPWSGEVRLFKYVYDPLSFCIDIPSHDFVDEFNNLFTQQKNDFYNIEGTNMNIKFHLNNKKYDLNVKYIGYNNERGYKVIHFIVPDRKIAFEIAQHVEVCSISSYVYKYDVKTENDLTSMYSSILSKRIEGKERSSQPFNINFSYKIKTPLNVSDSDIEKFVNEYISAVKGNKMGNDSKIKEVKKEDIRYWYNKDNYQSTIGKLGNSCMAYEEAGDYLDIYCENPNQVSLLILTNDNNLLIGRALLWKLENETYFMDRVYTVRDSDENIFYNYAIEKNYLYRDSKTNGYNLYKKGQTIEENLIVKLDTTNFEEYPYMDTLKYLNCEEDLLSNDNSNYDHDRMLDGTNGDYTDLDE